MWRRKESRFLKVLLTWYFSELDLVLLTSLSSHAYATSQSSQDFAFLKPFSVRVILCKECAFYILRKGSIEILLEGWVLEGIGSSFGKSKAYTLKRGKELRLLPL